MTTTDLSPTEVAPTGTDWIGVADALATELAPAAEAHDRSGAFVATAIDRVRATGLLTAPIPTELGGGGASHEEACAVLRHLGRGCGATAVTLSMHYHLVCTQVWRHHHGQPAQALLSRVADQRLVLISTGASDWLESSGSAHRVDGGYRVSGAKGPASGCPAGDVLVTSIRWDDGPDGPQVLHCSIPFSAEGVSIDETWDTLGLRATGSHTVVLDDVFVPDESVSLIRPAGRWHPIWNVILPTALPLIVSAYVGIAEEAVRVAVDLARPRSGAPHVAPLVGELLNELATAQDAVASMVRHSENLRFDNTDTAAAFALTRKTVAAEALVRVGRLAIDVAGGAGFSRAFPLERHARDLLGATFHPLPRAKQLLVTGRHALGLGLS